MDYSMEGNESKGDHSQEATIMEESLRVAEIPSIMLYLE
jgi:hypothetical protein